MVVLRWQLHCYERASEAAESNAGTTRQPECLELTCTCLKACKIVFRCGKFIREYRDGHSGGARVAG